MKYFKNCHLNAPLTVAELHHVVPTKSVFKRVIIEPKPFEMRIPFKSKSGNLVNFKFTLLNRQRTRNIFRLLFY